MHMSHIKTHKKLACILIELKQIIKGLALIQKVANVSEKINTKSIAIRRVDLTGMIHNKQRILYRETNQNATLDSKKNINFHPKSTRVNLTPSKYLSLHFKSLNFWKIYSKL